MCHLHLLSGFPVYQPLSNPTSVYGFEVAGEQRTKSWRVSESETLLSVSAFQILGSYPRALASAAPDVHDSCQRSANYAGCGGDAEKCGAGLGKEEGRGQGNLV